MFSQKLKELRLKANLTQKQIADKLGISQQAYARWETGNHKPTLDTLEKLSHFFNVPIEELISDKPLSIEKILSADTITYKNENLSDDELANLKQLIQKFIEL